MRTITLSMGIFLALALVTSQTVNAQPGERPGPGAWRMLLEDGPDCFADAAPRHRGGRDDWQREDRPQRRQWQQRGMKDRERDMRDRMGPRRDRQRFVDQSCERGWRQREMRERGRDTRQQMDRQYDGQRDMRKTGQRGWQKRGMYRPERDGQAAEQRMGPQRYRQHDMDGSREDRWQQREMRRKSRGMRYKGMDRDGTEYQHARRPKFDRDRQQWQQRGMRQYQDERRGPSRKMDRGQFEPGHGMRDGFDTDRQMRRQRGFMGDDRRQDRDDQWTGRGKRGKKEWRPMHDTDGYRKQRRRWDCDDGQCD